MMKNSKGYTLIEMLVALSVGVVVISAIAVAVVSALSNAQFSKNQSLASQAAQSGMEIMRRMRDSNYTTFSGLSGSYCLDQKCTQIDTTVNGCGTKSGASCGQNVDIYSREVTVVQPNDASDCNPLPPSPTPSSAPSNAKVTVTTYWSDGKCPTTNVFCHQVQLISCFSDYTVIPTPGLNEEPTSTPSPTPTPTLTPTPTDTPTP